MMNFMKKIVPVWVLVVIFSCTKEKDEIKKSKANVLTEFSIPGIGKLILDKTKKTLHLERWYNPDYIKILSREFVPTFKISEKATLIFDKKTISKGGKIQLKKITDSDKSTRFTGAIKVKAENGDLNTFTITVKIKGTDVDKNFLPQGYYPTEKYIGVYRTKKVSEEQLNRVYNDVKWCMDRMSDDLKNAMVKHGAKLLVAENEMEVAADDYFLSLIPLEGIYVNNGGTDETQPDSKTGISTAKLELMYLSVYYALLVAPTLQTEYQELQAAYKEAADKKLFTPGPAYQDGYTDQIHENASKKNALKYGSFIFNIYRLYFSNPGSISATKYEYKIGSKKDMQTKNPKAYAFLQKHYDVKK